MRNAARLCFVFLPLLALAQAAPQKPKIICDHAAPPPGMRWVCKSQCDCHLEGKMRNGDDGVATTSPPDDRSPNVCKYDAPKPGELLICDSDCQCRPYVAHKKLKKKSKP